MTSDPIADMLTRIRNAALARHDRTEIPTSKLKNALARILKDEGYITEFHTNEDSEGPQKKLVVVMLRPVPNVEPTQTRLASGDALAGRDVRNRRGTGGS